MAIFSKAYKIAAGYNNAGGLTLIQNLTDSNGAYFMSPRGIPYRTRGEPRVRLDGTIARVGDDSTQWYFKGMTVGQYWLLINTYEGKVTISTTVTSTTFANYNAILDVPDERDLEYHIFHGLHKNPNFIGAGYNGVILTFTRLEAL